MLDVVRKLMSKKSKRNISSSNLNDDSEANQLKLEKIWAIVNNYHYFSDSKTSDFYNMIHEVAEVIKPGYESIGDTFIEEERVND